MPVPPPRSSCGSPARCGNSRTRLQLRQLVGRGSDCPCVHPHARVNPLTGMRRTLLFSLVLPLTAACGAHRPPTVATASVQAPETRVPPPAPVPLDPAIATIASAEAAFERGRTEVEQGHLREARVAFDQSLDTLIESPDGARTRRAGPRRTSTARRPDQRAGTAASPPATASPKPRLNRPPSTPCSLDAFEPRLAERRPHERARDLATTVHDIPIPPTIACCAASSSSRAGSASS